VPGWGCWRIRGNLEQGDGLVELNFAATLPLIDLEDRLRAAGVDLARPTSDEVFGRQLQLTRAVVASRGPDRAGRRPAHLAKAAVRQSRALPGLRLGLWKRRDISPIAPVGLSSNWSTPTAPHRRVPVWVAK